MMSKLKKVTVLFRNRFNLSLQSMEVVKMSVLSHLSEWKEKKENSAANCCTLLLIFM